MNRYAHLSLVVVGTGLASIGLTGCIQFGEYAMGGECEQHSIEIRDAVRAELAAEPVIEDLWAGESTFWCRFVVDTGLDLAAEDPRRSKVAERIEDLIRDIPGIEISVMYVDQSDSFSTLASP